MYRVGSNVFRTFHEVVVWANEQGYLFDPDSPLADGDKELACVELEVMLVSDGKPV